MGFIIQQNRSKSSSQNVTHFYEKITTILTIAIFVLLVCCVSNNNKVKSTESSDTIITGDTSIKIKNDSLRIVGNDKAEVFLFKYSECNQNCNDFERIISKKHKGDTLLLKIGSIKNCIGKFRLDIEIDEKKLNLDIKVKEEIVKRKSGKVDTVLTTLDCQCYYYFEIGIKHIDKELETILINGNKFSRKQKSQVETIEK